ncbi:hypothetical protein N411_07750 [Helicobacter pylori FD535]|nr:hypothetical protein N411_07750 [Helicobacter pylori FD535]
MTLKSVIKGQGEHGFKTTPYPFKSLPSDFLK